MTMNIPTNSVQLGQLKRQLETAYRFSDGVRSLGEQLDRLPVTHKSTYTQNYSDKRINLEYVKLKTPKISYTLWYQQDGRDVGLEVSKMVYDAHIAPEEVNA